MSRLVRNATTLLTVAVLLVVGLGLAILAATDHDRAGAMLPTFGTRSASSAAATATAVFETIELPTGATPVVPARLRENRLAALGYYAAMQSSGVDRVGIWQLSLPIRGAKAYIEHHGPTGLTFKEGDVDVAANALGTYGGTVNFSSRSMVGNDDSTPYTRVSYSLTATAGNRPPTDVVVGVDVVWEPYRTALEAVPARTSTIRITRIGYHLGKVDQVVSTRSVTTRNTMVIARFAAVIDELQPFLLGQSASCFTPAITVSTTLYRYRLVFSGGSRSFTVDYGFCGYVGISSNGRAQPLLDDAPRRGGLVATQPLSNEIESVFSPGVPLKHFGS
jgi:hypothetical protein